VACARIASEDLVNPLVSNRPVVAAALSISAKLCLTCGLCCDGTLFKDVQLQPGDDPATLKNAGLRVTSPKLQLRSPCLRQPCAALGADCRCRVYRDRPTYCRQFECLLLKSVLAGRTEIPAALRIIRTARQRAQKVGELLRQLGNDAEEMPLSQRFRSVVARVQRAGIDEETGELFAELTLAVHHLNLLLSDSFYPGDGVG
jgi:uncharacterized protein